MTFQTFPMNEIYQIPNIQIVLSFTKKKKKREWEDIQL